MVDFKRKRQLRLKQESRLSRWLSRPVARFTVAGIIAGFTTLALFIFMNYLVGNIGRYAEAETEEFFTLDTTIIKLDGDGNEKRVERPQAVPEYPDLREYKDMIINFEEDVSRNAEIPDTETGDTDTGSPD